MSASGAITEGAQSFDGNKTFTGNVTVLGTLTPSVTADTTITAGAAGTAGTLQIYPATTAKGTTTLTASDNTGDTVTNVNTAAQAAARTYTVPDAGASASFVMTEGAQTVNGTKTFGTAPVASGASLTAGTVARTSLAQETSVVSPVQLTTARTWDLVSANLPATGGSDDLGLYNNTFLTTAPTVETGDVKATTTTRYARFSYRVPECYVAGGAVSIRINVGMKTTVADTSATVDVECVRVAAPSVDICTTAATTINSLTAANKDFTLTPTNIVVGDLLDFRITIAIVDAATGTAVIGTINTISALITAKG